MTLFKRSTQKIVSVPFLVFLLISPTAPAEVAPTAGKTATSSIDTDKAEAILQELKEIRRVLEKIEQQGKIGGGKTTPRPRIAKIALNKNRPVMGDADAPVTVVEITDYQCPFCLRFIRNTFPSLKRDYIDTGKVRWVVFDMPMPFHREARKAAQAAHCAGDQGKFWEMRELLFANPQKMTMEFLRGYAGDLELDVAAFNACLDSDKHLAEIDEDAKKARAVNLTGTPSFIVGKTTSGILSGKVIVGAQAKSQYESAILEALGEKP